jgi:hypothetical protein
VAEVTIQETTWQDLLRVARKRRKKPEILADQALREFLQRQADEDLLEQSSRAARDAPFRTRDTEEIIREYRKQKKSG